MKQTGTDYRIGGCPFCFARCEKNSTLNEVELHKRKVRIVKKYDTVSERSKNGTYSCRS